MSSFVNRLPAWLHENKLALNKDITAFEHALTTLEGEIAKVRIQYNRARMTLDYLEKIEQHVEKASDPVFVDDNQDTTRTAFGHQK